MCVGGGVCIGFVCVCVCVCTHLVDLFIKTFISVYGVSECEVVCIVVSLYR